VTLAPDADHWHGLTSAGFLTRSVEDTAVLLDTVIGGGAFGNGAIGDGLPAPDRDTPGLPGHRNLRDSVTAPPAALRIGTSTAGAAGPRPVKPDAAVLAALSATADVLGDLGHSVRAVDATIGPLQTTFIPRYLRGARDDAVRLVDRHALAPPARLATRLGGFVSERQVAAAQRRSAGLRDRLLGIFGETDVLLTPTMPTPPWPHDRFARSGPLRTLLASGDLVAYTSPWNVVGFPALSVPAGWTDEGLPLAVQLIGPPGSEARLLSLAVQLERRQEWGRRRPNLDIR
jgi:amidase